MTSTLPPLVQAFSGAIGSAASNTLTYPLDLVITRLQLRPPWKSEKHGGFVGAHRTLRNLVHERGWQAVYDGLWPDTCATVLSSFFYFYCYSYLRSLSMERRLPLSRARTKKSSRLHKPSLLEELLLGFIAGVASRAISTPLNIITLRLQASQTGADTSSGSDSTGSDSESEDTTLEYETIMDIVKGIYRIDGLAGFWRGFRAAILLSLNPSITMTFMQVYRRLLSVMQRTSHSLLSARGLRSVLQSASVNRNLHPWEGFLGGAISNSIAILMLYPLILAKTRVQAAEETSMQKALTEAYTGTYRRNLQPKRKSEKKKDMKGLYQGLQMKLLKAFLGQGVTFLVKDRIEQLIVALYLMRVKRSRA